MSENLAQRQKQLFWMTEQKTKELNYKFIWSGNGQIYVKGDKNSERLHTYKIRSDLDKF